MRAALLVFLAAGGCADELSPVFSDASECNATIQPSGIDGGSPSACSARDSYSSVTNDAGELLPLPTATIARPGVLLAHAEMCSHPGVVIDLQLYAGKGGLPALVPGDYVIGEADASFATCGICVRLFTRVDQGGNPGDMYLARSGTLTLEDIGGEGGTGFAARLSDVQVRQVTIDPGDFSTEDVGGCESVLGVPGIGDLLLRGAVRAGHDAVRVDSMEAGNDRSP